MNPLWLIILLRFGFFRFFIGWGIFGLILYFIFEASR